MTANIDIFTKRGLDPDGAVVRAQGFRRYEGADRAARLAAVSAVEPLYAEDYGPTKTRKPPAHDPEVGKTLPLDIRLRAYEEAKGAPDPVRSWRAWRSWAFGVDGWLMPRHAVMPDSAYWYDRPVAQLRPDLPLPGKPQRHAHRQLGALARWQHERKAHGGERVQGWHSHDGEAKYVYTPGDTALRLGTNPLVLERGWGTPDDLFVFVMEGTLKMCAVAEAGYPVIDAGSVTLWHGQRDLEPEGEVVWDDGGPRWVGEHFDEDAIPFEREIDVFAERHLNDRAVAVVCDSDWNENDAVRRQTDAVVRVLEGHGARAVACAPPPKLNGEKNGIDDWLGRQEPGDRREALPNILVPGPALLTADHPLLASIRRSDGRESAAALALAMGARADGEGVAAYRRGELSRDLARSRSVLDRALENGMRCGLVSQLTEAERRGEGQGMTAPLYYVGEEARPRPVTLRSWLGL